MDSPRSLPQVDGVGVSDCWNHIGVWSPMSATCPVLKQVIHCQNCAVYAGAGRGLLERAAPSDYVHEWTAVLSRGKQLDASETVSLLIFRLSSEWLALPTAVFREVTEIRSIHSLPHNVDPTVRGLVNIRGQLQICVSLSNLLGIPATDADDQALGHIIYKRMIVIGSDSVRFVFAVDEIWGIHAVGRQDINEVPVTIANSKAAFSRGVLLFRDALRDESTGASTQRQVGCLDGDLLIHALRKRILSRGER
jgi:chemotaxis-related protein WspD